MRCKMVLRALGESGDTKTMEFQAVADGSDENRAFFAATPYGELRLGVVNPDAAKGLEVGASYYIDITSAPK